MESSGESLQVIAERRLFIATWIQDGLQPVGQLLSDSAELEEPLYEFETRDYQLDAWAYLWQARQDGAKTGLIHLATGLGKTSVAVFDVMKFREEYDGPRKGGPKVLFVSHQEEINDQAAERFEAFIPDMSQGTFSGRKKETGKDITFATLQSLHRNLDMFNPRYFDYIVYDEAHHLKAKTFERVVKHFKPRFQLALTATPDRMDGLDIRELFGKELFSKGLAEALAEGHLADVDYHIVFDDAVKAAIESGFEPDTLQELHTLLDVEPRNETIARNVREEMHSIGLDNARTIAFCEDIEHAEAIAELLGGEAYHSGIKDRKQRRDVLNRFKNGERQIITTRDMFNEGVDIPDARLLVFLRSIGSRTVFEQQLGRGLRKAKGKEKVTVLDFAANIERIALVRELGDAIVRHSKDIGAVGEEAITGSEDEEERGLHIHTGHTDFDFDKISVDLLGKYFNIVGQEASEGVVSLVEFVEQVGTTRVTLKSVIEEMEIDTEKYRFGSRVAEGLTLDQQAAILKHPKIATENAGQAVVSVTRFARAHNMGWNTVNDIIKREGIEIDKYKFPDGRVRDGLALEQQAKLEELIAGEQRPAEIASLPAFAKRMKSSPAKVQAIIDELGVAPKRYRFGSVEALGLTPEEQGKILEHEYFVAKASTDGIASIRQFAIKRSITAKQVQAIAERAGVELSSYKFGAHTGLGVTQDQQAVLDDAITRAQEKTGAMVTVGEFAINLGVSVPTIEKAIKRAGITLDNIGVKKSRGITNEQQEILRSMPEITELLDTPEADESILSINQFIKNNRTSKPTVYRIADENGIELKKYRFSGNVTFGLTPAQQEQLGALLHS